MKKKDMTGMVFGDLVVVGLFEVNNRREAVWKCLCDCGNTTNVAGSLLRNGRTKSCGCRKSRVSSTPKILHRFIGNEECKRCSSCTEWKKPKDFFVSKSNWDGLSYECKSCKKKRSENNRESILAYKKEYRDSHHNEIIKKALEYVTKRSEHDTGFRLRNVLASRIRMAIKKQGAKKSSKTIELIGCSVDYLRTHLESMFDDKMSWDNYGSYWHIDHRRPCASFDLTDPEQQKECFHYSNLQPMFWLDNIKKSDKFEWRV